MMIMAKGGMIEGRVTDVTGQPIAGVTIYNEEYYWFDSQASSHQRRRRPFSDRPTFPSPSRALTTASQHNACNPTT